MNDADIARDAAENARLARIADVFAQQTRLQTIPNDELIMLGLAEIIAFMPQADAGGSSREALWRELWRRGCGLPVISSVGR
jgi:hypothetical protein